jgi:hypothetical protein
LKISNAEAVTNRYSQADIIRLVSALNRFEKKIERLVHGTSARLELTEGVEHLAENVRVAAASGKFLSFSKK